MTVSTKRLISQIRTAFAPKNHRRQARNRVRRRHASIEQLEVRALLSANAGLLKDINTKTEGVGQTMPVDVNGVGYFLARSSDLSQLGLSLWKTDGTTGGTLEVTRRFANSFGTTYSLTNVSGTLFFTANDGSTGRELWKTDGTEQGTVLVRDIVPGSGGSIPRNLTDVNGILYFAADDDKGAELWRSDGTRAGTYRLRDINPTGSARPTYLTNFNGTLIFSANNGPRGHELWRSDGTQAGTVMVRDLAPGSTPSYPRSFATVGALLYFSAESNSLNDDQLWKTDGTSAGTILVKDLPSSGTSSRPLKSLTNVSGTLFFSGKDTAGQELWTSDGTTAGTWRLKDILPGKYSAAPSQLVNIGGTLFFEARDSLSNWELWKSDGTSTGTVQVRDINPGPKSSSPRYLTNLGGVVYFIAHDGINGGKLWKSDGSEAGTVQVEPNPPGTADIRSSRLTRIGDRIVYNVFDELTGSELRQSDGTTAGITTLLTIPPNSDGSEPRRFTSSGNKAFFTADSRLTSSGVGYELWVTDGSESGTVKLAGGDVGSEYFFPRSLTDVSGTLFFVAGDSAYGTELWKSDGTIVGTTLVRDINPGPSGSQAYALQNVNGTLYFRAASPATGREMWTSDGTASGTRLIKDIRPGSEGSRAGGFTSFADEVVFVANDGTTGYELWKTDGTEDGTVRFTDILLGPGTASPTDLTVVDGQLFFTAELPGQGRELWVSDGTTDGTRLVKDIRPGPNKSAPLDLYNMNGVLYFAANDGTHGQELWRSDGTENGTFLVRDIRPGSRGSNIAPYSTGYSKMINANGTLFFRAEDDAHGSELWKSDGTEAGTVLLRDLREGPFRSYPGFFTSFGSGALFFADGQLWFSDGTDEGTSSLADSAVATSDGDEALALLEDWVIYRGYEPRIGMEPFRLSLAAPTSAPTGVVVSEGASNRIIDWNDLAAGVQYDILIQRIGDQGGIVVEQRLFGLQLELTETLNDGPYRVWVRGVSLRGEPGPWSKSTGFAVGPVPVILPTANRSTEANANVQWVAPTGYNLHDLWVNNLDTGQRVLLATDLSESSLTFAKPLAPGRYAAWVRSGDSAGVFTDWSAVQTFEIIAPAVTITDGIGESLDAQPTLTWGVVDGATSWEMIVQIEGTNTIAYRDTSIQSTQSRIQRALPADRYTVWVRALYKGRPLSAWGPGQSLQIKLPPNGIRANSTAIQWTPVSGASNYDLFVRNSVTQSSVAQVQNIAGTRWQLTPELPPGRYDVQSRSNYAEGANSLLSDPLPFEVFDKEVPITSSSEPTADATPIITWQGSPGATSYEIYVSDVNSQQRVYAKRNLTEMSHRITNPLPAGTYRIWVRAHFSNGARSLWGDGTTLEVGPKPIVSISDRTLNWTSVRDATHYEFWIDYLKDDGSRIRVVHRPLETTTSFLLPQALRSGRYTAWVRAIRAESGDLYLSRWSDPVVFRLSESD
jgi:ELWxxDGT repeat protein